MFLSESSEVVFTRLTGKCRLDAVTTETGVGSYSIWINKRRETAYGVAGSFSTWKMYVIFRRLPQNCEKRLLATSCPSVRMEQLGSHWTDFHEI